MSTGTDQKQASVSVDVAASPEVVWSVVSDLGRMGDWSPECFRVRWKDGAPGPGGPSVGASFKGSNKIGIRRWSTKGTVVAAEANRKLAWDVASLGLPIARWTYTITPTENGSRLTESYEDKRGALLNVVGPLVTGVKDRAPHNEVGMKTTLERMKAAAEARAAQA
jgi:hypothetical protein